MTKLKTKKVATLVHGNFNWKYYIGYLTGYVKDVSFHSMITKLNSVHPIMQLTYEVEKRNRIPFLDSLVTRYENIIGDEGEILLEHS